MESYLMVLQVILPKADGYGDADWEICKEAKHFVPHGSAMSEC